MATDIHVRRVHPDDAPALRDFYARLSAESRRARFLGCVGDLTTEQSLTFCTPDHMHAEGFVAISDRPTDRGAVLGHLCLEPVDDRRLELAVAVADAEQGRGIGRALFRTAVDWAVEHRYREVLASCFATNSRVLSLLSSAPYGSKITTAEAGLVDVAIPLMARMPEVSISLRTRDRRHQSVTAHQGARRHAVWRRTIRIAPRPTAVPR